MQSDRNIDKSNNLKKLKQLLTSHKEVMLGHIEFLKKVKLNEISETEFADYLEDMTGLTRKYTLVEKAKFIDEMLASANQTCKAVISLAMMIKDDLNDVDIDSLYTTIQYLIAVSKHHNHELTYKHTPWDNKARYAFNFHDITKYCLKILEPCTSENIDLLNRACEIITSNSNFKKNNKHTTEFSFETNMLFKLSLLTVHFKSKKSTLDEFAFELDFIKIKNANNMVLNELTKLNIPLNEQYIILSLINQKNDQVSRWLESLDHKYDREDMVDVIKVFYGRIKNIRNFIELFIAIQFQLNSINEFFEIKKSVEIVQPQILTKISKLIDKLDIVEGKIIKLKSNDKLLEQLNSLKETINTIQLEWKKEISPNSILGFKLMQQMADVIIDSALNDIVSMHAQINDIVQQERIAEQIVKKSEEVNVIEGSIDAAEKQAILDFNAKKTEETKAYKEKVAEKRAKKETEKLLANVSVSNNSIFAEPKSIVANQELEPILTDLKEKKLELIKDILISNLDAKITYSDVYHLIINHLNGNIDEIGNGSSHKCIRIGKFYTEISSSRDDVKIKEVTGGFYRPHNPGHNNEILSAFNLSLVAKTFVKAGITSDVINQLLDNLKVVVGKGVK